MSCAEELGVSSWAVQHLVGAHLDVNHTLPIPTPAQVSLILLGPRDWEQG